MSIYFKKASSLFLIVLTSGLTITTFQNCNNKASFKASSRDLASVSDSAVGNNFCSLNPTDSSCLPPPTTPVLVKKDCSFNGQILSDSQTVVAYQNSTVSFGSACKSEVRKCDDGTLSGSYNFSSCSAGQPASCLFNGKTIASGTDVEAYENSSVEFGLNCKKQVRSCNNGTLSGSYNYASCSVGQAKSCLFDGKTIAHNDVVNAFQNSSVGFGLTCNGETRKCFNGTLTGSFNFSSCNVGSAAACMFDGKTIAHGQNITAFLNSSVSYGQSCNSQSRNCNNGQLSGTYNFSSCQIDKPASCLFNGKTVAHNEKITAFQNSNVSFGGLCNNEERICDNGKLSGSYSFDNCTIAQPNSCQFNGVTIAHGQGVNAFLNSSAAFGSSCSSQNRICNNGILSGAYSYSSCSVGAAASCLFNGVNLAHGQSVSAFSKSTVPYGDLCLSEQRTCNNGLLSGSNSYSSCEPAQPASCLFNNVTIAHGQEVNAFQTSTVAFGNTCTSQSRICNNGNLSGNYSYANCSTNQPASCIFNGNTIANGQQVNAFSTASVGYNQQCSSQARTCNNGDLSGNFTHSSCTTEQPLTCNFNGQIIGHNQSVTVYSSSLVAFGESCASQQRTCTNGNLSGSYIATSCSVQPPALCPLNGENINHGSQVTRFQSATVPFGESCTSEVRGCNNGNLSGSFTNVSCVPEAPANCSINGVTVNHGEKVIRYQSSQVQEPATCQAEERTCQNGKIDGSYIESSCSVKPLLAAQCNVYYKYRTSADAHTSPLSNGAWATFKNKDQNYNCKGAGCGLQVGVSCTGEAEIKLTYQYQEFSTAGIEQSTPWSGTDGQVQWGQWALLQRTSHPEDECANGLNCGLRVSAETKNGKPCSVSYQYQAEKSHISPIQSDGAWSLTTGINGSDNCDDGLCGVRIKLSCEPNSGAGYTPPPSGDTGGDINPYVNEF